MDDKIQDSRSKVSARRRLIRGAFATPAVFTLCSGGALAQSTSRLSCIRKANDPPIPAPGVDTTNSTYLRVQLWLQDGKYYVLGTSLPLPRLTTLVPNGQMQEFDVIANVLVGSPVPVSGTLSVGDQYAVLRVNAEGVVVDVGNTSTDVLGSAIGKSCWTSFAPPPMEQ